MKHWINLEKEIGYKTTRIIAYLIYLSFFFDRKEHYHTCRKVIEYYEYLPYKIKKIVDNHFSTILNIEIEDMILTNRRDLNWLVGRYKL